MRHTICRSSDDIEAPTAAAVPLQEAIAPIADNCASPDEFSKTAPALTFSASKSGGIFQNVLSSAAAKVGGKLRTRMMSVINPKTSSAVAAMVTGEPTNQRPTRTKRRTVDGM